jgi:hypothetical protein
MIEKKVKLDNGNSRFAKKAEEKKKTEAEFNGQITEYQEQKAELLKRTAESTTKFFELIKDTRLKENKGVINLEMEKQICRDVIDLSLILNQDQSEAEGIGSAGVNLMLLKVVLSQRDKINELAYKISKLEKTSSPAENVK